MNILYISSVMAKTVHKEITKKLKQPTQYSIQKFHSLLLDGINKNENVNITALSGLPISRKKSKKFWWKKINIKEEGINYIHLPFINLPILKQLFITIGMLIETIKWNNKNDNKYIICDAAYATVTPIIVWLSKKFNIKVIAIVADIYDYMSEEVKSTKKSIYREISKKISKWTFKNYSGYILLTEAMNTIVNKQNKPYIIMEGLVDTNAQDLDNVHENKYKEKVCIYAGGIHEKYGVKNLIEAFTQLDIEDAKLYIYGVGDLKEYLENLKNDKIVYCGSVDNKEVVKQEKKATLLINPRFTNEEYTKFSFPSKIMEYMSSGTAVLTTKLAGIPEEYDKYLYYIEDETISGMKETIERILKKEREELISFGNEAQQFVLNEKNNIIQGKNIIDFLQKIV